MRVGSIGRNFDQFLFRQILSEGNPTGNFSVRKETFERMELLFNETVGRSVSSELDQFFNAFQDLSSNPSGLPERTSIVAQSQSLVASFNAIGEAIFREQQNLDVVVEDTVAQINSKLRESLNSIKPSTPMSLEFHRQMTCVTSGMCWLKSYPELIDVTLVDENNGQVRLTLSDGKPLVLGLNDFPLSTQLNGDNLGFKDILISDGSGGTQNITTAVTGGELRGLLDMRDREIPQIKQRFDLLAAGLVREVNLQHRQGIGLDGSTGVDFFTNLAPTVRPRTTNTGSAVVTVTNASPTTSSVDQYQIQFTGASSFDLVNQSTGQASGSFTFTSGSTFNLGNGLAVNITGAGAAGDLVDFSVSTDAASLISLNSAVVADSQKIASGNNSPGDGGNATKISNLQNRLLFNSNAPATAASGAFTIGEFFTSLITDIGIETRTAQSIVTQQEGIKLQLNNQRESVSGVSIDEEMINLIKFQQAFAASARLINVVDEMFDILQNRI